MFTKEFDRYVCEGDNITCDVDGITYVATLVADTESRPEDSECYTKSQIEKWRNDEWSFFGVIISANVDGVTLGDHLASLWGIEGNFPSRRKNPNTYFLQVANELLHEAIPEAKKARLAILAKLESVGGE